MSNLTLDEMETSIIINAADRSIIEVYSDDPVWQRRLEKLAGPGRPANTGPGRFWTLDASYLALRKPRQLSDEQRALLAERARVMFRREVQP